MCGRFTQHYTWGEVHAFLNVFGAARNLRPRYNIAPTDDVDVIWLKDGVRELVTMRWGLVPFFWKLTLKEVPATFNARAETVADKPMFRDAFKRRCWPSPACGIAGATRRQAMSCCPARPSCPARRNGCNPTMTACRCC